jgi:hypothetical protein
VRPTVTSFNPQRAGSSLECVWQLKRFVARDAISSAFDCTAPASKALHTLNNESWLAARRRSLRPKPVSVGGSPRIRLASPRDRASIKDTSRKSGTIYRDNRY